MHDHSHALVVGGTGMLRGATLALTRQYRVVSVIARRLNTLRNVMHDASPQNGPINPIALDYRDSNALRNAIGEAIAQHGHISLVVAWIHESVAPDAPRIVAESVSAKAMTPFRFFHVLGSVAARPDAEHRKRTWIDAIPHLRYRTILLGFIIDNNGAASRWLTDEEISAGVLHAIETDAESSIVGVIEPWSRRP